MARQASVYEHAVEISKDYLGPAAERFIRRQIMTHLHKQPETLTASDIKKLVGWVRLTFALLTEDTQLVEAYSKQLLSLNATKAAGNAKKS